MAQPVVRPIQGTLQDGSLITIQGSTPPSSNGFSINITRGPGDLGTADILLHVNPRFNENSTPRNSYQNNVWGAEDRSGPPGVPIQKGSAFECIILCQNDKFMVSFNGQHFCEFKHRIPKEQATHVLVKGDVQVNNVLFSGAGGGFGGQTGASTMGGYGQPMSGGYGQPSQPGGYGQPMGGQSQPQCVNIPGGMQPGRIIYINGNPAPNSTGFSVNLKYQQQGGDIAFHFNVRLNERSCVKNSLQNGSWGQEERATGAFPFSPGTPFQMMILGDQECRVAVNGSHFTEFKLRNPNLQAIQWVEIMGDTAGFTVAAP